MSAARKLDPNPECSVEKTASRLLNAGFWPIAVYPKGFPIKDRNGNLQRLATGKEPMMGTGWGLRRKTLTELLKAIRSVASEKDADGRPFVCGLGVCLGPGRAPGGGWLFDGEGDGPEAEDSISTLFGGEVIPTVGWPSRRGRHRLYRGDGNRLAQIAARSKPFQVKDKGGSQPGVFHIPTLPGLELRLGGWKEATGDAEPVAKQLQSVVPPTPGTDGVARKWDDVGEVAQVPESFYEALAAAVDAALTATKQTASKAKSDKFTVQAPRGSDRRLEAWLKKAIDNAMEVIAGEAEGKRHTTLLALTRTMAGYLHFPECFPESELRDRAIEAGESAKQNDAAKTVADAIVDGRKNPLPYPDQLLKDRPGWKDQQTAETPATANARAWLHQPEPDDEQPISTGRIEASSKAFYGVAGEVVRRAEAHTEADPIGILAQILLLFGNLIGRGPHFTASADEHYTNINVVNVGLTSSGRKGMGFGVAKWWMKRFDPDWCKHRIKSGLISGEGLIHAVRDPSYALKEIKQKKGEPPKPPQFKRDGTPCPDGYEEVEVDCGVLDKRLVAPETEFSKVMKNANREGNTLSDHVRQCWEGGDMSTMGKTNPSVATGAHISIIGHTTPADVRRHLGLNESANGFANRFIWIMVYRSKYLPEGGDLDGIDWSDLEMRFRDAVDFGRTIGRMRRDEAAVALWDVIYRRVSLGKIGVVAEITARAEPQIMRLAMIYALLDMSPVVKVEHLEAAGALWDYSEESAKAIFGDSQCDAESNKILAAVQGNPEGLTRTQIHELWGRHQDVERIKVLLRELRDAGLIHSVKKSATGKGRPAEIWLAGPDPEAK